MASEQLNERILRLGIQYKRGVATWVGRRQGFSRAVVFLVSRLMGGDNINGRSGLPGNGARISNEEVNKAGSEAASHPLVEETDESQQDEISWPRVTIANAMSQIPSFARRDPLESHGGSMFQGGRTRELVRGN